MIPLAVSTANTDLAAVTNDRTELRWSRTATGEVHTVLSEARNLLRPQFSGSGELWALSGSGSDQRMWLLTADKRIEVSAEKVLGRGEVTAFRISPDGARIALIRKSGDRSPARVSPDQSGGGQDHGRRLAAAQHHSDRPAAPTPSAGRGLDRRHRPVGARFPVYLDGCGSPSG